MTEETLAAYRTENDRVRAERDALQAKLDRVREYMHQLRKGQTLIEASTVAFKLHSIIDPEDELTDEDVTEPEGLA